MGLLLLLLALTAITSVEADCSSPPPALINASENAPSGAVLLQLPTSGGQSWTMGVREPSEIRQQLTSFLSLTSSAGNVTLTLNASLDLELIHASWNFSLVQILLELECQSSASQRIFDVVLLVNPVNEFPPEFVGGPFAVNMSEDMSVGTTVLVLRDKVVDDDINPSEPEISNFLMHVHQSQADGSSKFRINNQGDISLLEAVDFEALPDNLNYYLLNISVSDRGGLTDFTEVRVRVNDVDDLGPEFTYPGCVSPCFPLYTATLAFNYTGLIENVQPSAILARDQDSLGSPIAYRLLGAQPFDLAANFSVDGSTGQPSVIHPLTSSLSLDSVVLIIQGREVTPKNLTAVTTLTLRLVPATSPPGVDEPSTAESVPVISAVYIVAIVLMVCISLILITAIIAYICYHRKKRSRRWMAARRSPREPGKILWHESIREKLVVVFGGGKDAREKEKQLQGYNERMGVRGSVRGSGREVLPVQMNGDVGWTPPVSTRIEDDIFQESHVRSALHVINEQRTSAPCWVEGQFVMSEVKATPWEDWNATLTEIKTVARNDEDARAEGEEDADDEDDYVFERRRNGTESGQAQEDSLHLDEMEEPVPEQAVKDMKRPSATTSSEEDARELARLDADLECIDLGRGTASGKRNDKKVSKQDKIIQDSLQEQAFTAQDRPLENPSDSILRETADESLKEADTTDEGNTDTTLSVRRAAVDMTEGNDIPEDSEPRSWAAQSAESEGRKSLKSNSSSRTRESKDSASTEDTHCHRKENVKKEKTTVFSLRSSGSDGEDRQDAQSSDRSVGEPVVHKSDKSGSLRSSSSPPAPVSSSKQAVEDDSDQMGDGNRQEKPSSDRTLGLQDRMDSMEQQERRESGYSKPDTKHVDDAGTTDGRDEAKAETSDPGSEIVEELEASGTDNTSQHSLPSLSFDGVDKDTAISPSSQVDATDSDRKETKMDMDPGEKSSIEIESQADVLEMPTDIAQNAEESQDHVRVFDGESRPVEYQEGKTKRELSPSFRDEEKEKENPGTLEPEAVDTNSDALEHLQTEKRERRKILDDNASSDSQNFVTFQSHEQQGYKDVPVDPNSTTKREAYEDEENLLISLPDKSTQHLINQEALSGDEGSSKNADDETTSPDKRLAGPNVQDFSESLAEKHGAVDGEVRRVPEISDPDSAMSIDDELVEVCQREGTLAGEKSSPINAHSTIAEGTIAPQSTLHPPRGVTEACGEAADQTSGSVSHANDNLAAGDGKVTPIQEEIPAEKEGDTATSREEETLHREDEGHLNEGNVDVFWEVEGPPPYSTTTELQTIEEEDN